MKTIHHGAIIINNHAQKGAVHQAERLAHELTALGSRVSIVKNTSYLCRTIGDKVTSSMAQYDYCVFLDKDKYLLKALEIDNVPTFNSYNAISTCDDKMLTYLALSHHNIPMPITLAAPLCYTANSPLLPAQLSAIESTLTYPMIVKQCYGSLGKQVHIVQNSHQLTTMLLELQHKPHIIQQYIRASHGKDIRVIVVAGKVLGCMLRCSDEDFRSNVAQGGRTAVYPLTPDIEHIALTVANTLQLDYCGLDLLMDDNQLLLCEVNSNAFFDAFEQTTSINVAREYARHILSTIDKPHR